MSNFQPAALAGAIALASSFSVSANDVAATTATLDTLVITATRSEEKIEHVPARISIIEPRILEQSAITALPDLLKIDPSINVVQSGGYGQQTSLFLRGTNSTQTLVLRDGVRLNSATTGAASIPFLDTTDIQQIEVLKGPASVLYGTDAIGGVVQFVTKTPQKSAAFVTSEIGESKTYKSLVGADLAENGIYAQVRGQILESDGTSVFNLNDHRNYSFDQKGYSAKFGVDREQYAASLDYSQNQGNNQYNSWGTFMSQDFENEVVNLKMRVNPTKTLEIHTRLSQFKDNLDQTTTANSNVHSTTQEAELYSKWQISQVQNILAGVTTRSTAAKTNALNEDIQSTGYYLQHQYQANGLSTQLGVRLEDNEKFGTHSVVQGGVRYQLLPNTSIYTNIGTAFKAPTLNDMYAWGGNDLLDPEESISYEIGVDQRITANLLVGASIFYTEVDNMINSTCVSMCDGDWENTFPVYQNKNIDQASMQGAELSAKWTHEDYFLSTGYSYVKTEDEDKGTELLRRPRQSLSLSTGLENADYGISATLTAKSKSKDFSQDIPGYARIDLNAYWNIHPHVKLFSNIENIADVQYKTVHSSGAQYYVNGGRLASAGVTFKY